MNILSPSQMKELEGIAEKQGHSPELLMRRAASAAYRVVRAEYPLLTGPVVVLCGRGNNGGDGLALAWMLHRPVEVCLPLGEPPEGSLGAEYLARCREKGIPLRDGSWFLERKAGDIGLLVDALLGTGLNRPVEGHLLGIIKKIPSLNTPVISLDIPSGINGLNGSVEGDSVKADHTVTFGLPKGGNMFYPGFDRGGALHLSAIGIPAELREHQTSLVRVNNPLPLGKRSTSGHKATWGRLLVVGGSGNYAGAPRFASQAFMKSGGGYVHMAVPERLAPSLVIGFPEAVLHPMIGEAGCLELNHIDELTELIRGKSALVLGPGMGLGEGTERLFEVLIEKVEMPLIIDGDGLSHLAGKEELLKGKEVYLTPHPGEAARMLGISVKEGEGDRLETVRKLADRYGAHVVLKGAHSLITAPGEGIYMNLSGNSSLATAGSGDILSGIIPSLLGAGLAGTDALRTAVYLHGRAGEEAGREKGEDGVTASDILDCLPCVLRDYRLNYDRYSSGTGGRIRKLS